jgi:hypothetical protein
MAAMLGVARNMDVVIRTADDPTPLVPSVEKIVHQLDPLLVISRAHTMDEIVAATESSRRFKTTILTAFAAIALMLSFARDLWSARVFCRTAHTRDSNPHGIRSLAESCAAANVAIRRGVAVTGVGGIDRIRRTYALS